MDEMWGMDYELSPPSDPVIVQGSNSEDEARDVSMGPPKGNGAPPRSEQR